MGEKFGGNGKLLRQVPENMKFAPPVEIISQLMKKKSGELDELKSRYEKKLEGDDKVFSELALQVFSLNRIIDRYGDKLREGGLKPLYDELRITRNKLAQALESGGISIADLTGREIDDTVLELAEVIGWLPDEREKEYVVETYEPLVKHDDNIIRPAKVIGGTRSLLKDENNETKGSDTEQIQNTLEGESQNEDK